MLAVLILLKPLFANDVEGESARFASRVPGSATQDLTVSRRPFGAHTCGRHWSAGRRPVQPGRLRSPNQTESLRLTGLWRVQRMTPFEFQHSISTAFSRPLRAPQKS